MAHVICSRKILSIVDEWSVVRTYDDIIEDWYLNQDGTFKHLIISGVEYSHWKLFLVPQDILYSPMHWKPAAGISATGIYSSLSSNKNILTKEMASLGEENLKAFTLSKEFVRLNNGAHKMIVTPEMRNSILDAYNRRKTRRRDEELAPATLDTKKKEEKEHQKDGLKCLNK